MDPIINTLAIIFATGIGLAIGAFAYRGFRIAFPNLPNLSKTSKRDLNSTFTVIFVVSFIGFWATAEWDHYCSTHCIAISGKVGTTNLCFGK